MWDRGTRELSGVTGKILYLDTGSGYQEVLIYTGKHSSGCTLKRYMDFTVCNFYPS